MSDKNRSLASYFDDPHAPAQNWYDQTERMGDGMHGQESFLPEDHGHQLSDDEDDLDSEMLGAWMMHPEHAKQVWVPDGVFDVFAKPPGKQYQEKGNETWKADHWGATDHERRYKQSQQEKMDRKGETREQRAARMKETKGTRQKMREVKIKILQDARKAAYDAYVRNPAWAPEMLDILNTAESQKDILTAQKNTTITMNKQSGTLKTAKDKEIALHSEKTAQLTQGPAQMNWSTKLETIDRFCKTHSLQNIVGTTIPTLLPDNEHYLFVALDFLGQVKKQVMTSIRIILMKKLKSVDKPKDRDTYLFINSSNLANTLRKQLSKDKYPKKPKKYLPDRAALIEWATKVRKLELAAFKATHGKNAKIPKRLRNGPPPKGRRHMVVYPHGRGRPPMYFMPMPMPMYQPQYGRRGRNNYHRHGRKGRNHYKPTYEQEAGSDGEEDMNNAGGTIVRYKHPYRSKLPPVGPPPMEPDGYNIPYGNPWQTDPWTTPDRAQAASRMHRGYF